MKILFWIAVGVFFERAAQQHFEDGTIGLIKRSWEIGTTPAPKPYSMNDPFRK